MKRKGLWLAGLVLAALLAISPEANAGGWTGYRTGPPFRRHVVVAGYPGRVWVGGYWGWYHARHHWFPGRWVVRGQGREWGHEGWRHGHFGRGFHEGFRRRR
jgi:hypothetical protein